MKKILVVLAMFGFFSPLCFGQTGSTQAEKKPKYEKTSGVVESLLENKLKLRTRGGGVKEFILTTETMVQRNGEPATTGQIHAGDPVKVLRFEKKSRTILRIEIGS